MKIFGNQKKTEKYQLNYADEGINVFVFLKEFIDSPAVEGIKAFTGDNVDKLWMKTGRRLKTS